MKKYIWFGLLLLMAGLSYPASLSYVAGGEVKDLEKTEEKNLALNGGFKGSISFLEGAFYVKDKAFSYGLSLKTPEIVFGKENSGRFSAGLKGGMITKSGFAGFLGNPGLSGTVSPFSSDERTFSMMAFSLPGYTTSVNTRHAGFLEMNMSQGNWFFSGSLFYCPFRKEKRKESSLLSGALQASWTPGWVFVPKLKIQMGAVYENAGYEEKKSDVWYEKSSFYYGGRANSGLISLRIGTGPYGGKPEFWIYFHSMFFENPFEKVNLAFRGNLVFGYGGTSFLAEVFYNPKTGLFTSEGKTLDPEISGKGTLSQKVSFGKKKSVSLTAGIGGFWKENLLYLDDELKLSGGIKLSVFNTAVSLTAKNEWKTLEIKKAGFYETKLNPVNFSASGNLSVSLKYFSLETSGNYSKAYEKEVGEWKTGLSMEGGISKIKARIKMETGFTKEKLKSADLSFLISGKI